MASEKKIIRIQNKKTEKRGSALKYGGLAIILLAVFSLVFSSLMSGGGGSNGNSLVFGRYGNKNIVYQYNNSFGLAVSRESERYESFTDQENVFLDFYRRNAWQQAFSSVAVSTAIAYHLEKSGYIPTPRAVDRLVVEFGPYRTNNTFDDALYRAASDASKSLTRERFTEQIIMDTWSADVLSAQFRSQAAIDFIADMRSTVRTYDFITLPFSDFPVEDVMAYAQENSKIFRVRPLSRITVETEETANELIEKLNANTLSIENFANTAMEHSIDSYKDDGGDMGPTQFHRLTETMKTEDADAVFSAETNALIGPFNTDYGWVMLYTDGPVSEIDAASSVDDIRSYMLENDLGVIEDTLLAQAKDLIQLAREADGFSSAITSEGYSIKTTSAFPINYAGDSLLGASPESTGDSALSGTAVSDEFWNAIVALDRVGEISEPVVLSGAIGVFSLASENTEPLPENWENTVKYEAFRSRQNNLSTTVLNNNSKLFVDNFAKTYAKAFPDVN